MDCLKSQGLDEQGAWERTREVFLFPPAEEEADEEEMPMSIAHRAIAENMRAGDLEDSE